MNVINKLQELKKYIKDVDVVIFDLDDTLYPEKQYVRSGYKKIADYMQNVEKMEHKLWEAFLKGEPAIDAVLEREGLLTEEIKNKCVKIYRNQVPEISFYEGAEELLLELKSEGKRLAVITDGRPEGQRAKIKALNLEGYFEKIIITDELGGIEYRKPNEKAFVLMREFFDSEYEKMIYIGDNPKKDFQAPEKLGMKSVHIVNTDGLYNK